MLASTKPVIYWLFASAAMVVVMMLIGAATRLTESGLSMVEWRPLIGWIPPFTEAEWARVFDLYRQTSEYRLQHAGMELPAFETIFWWEYFHRVWGRLTGLVFALPFVWFLLKRQIPRNLVPHLVVLLLLGGLQGLIGWWMVKSGFVNRADVSQYRLVVHLAMALGILAYLLWLALGMAWAGQKPVQSTEKSPIWVIFGVFALTILSGGFVAGLNAGVIYNDWPDMGGGLMPSDYMSTSVWWLNAFESQAAAQFHHRILAYCSFAAAVWFCWTAHRRQSGPQWRFLAKLVLAAACVQLLLGIATLLLVVPVGLGVAHQLGAIMLFCLSVAGLRLVYPGKAI